MTEQPSLVPDLDNLDRLDLNQLSRSSPSRLPPFPLKQSRSQQNAFNDSPTSPPTPPQPTRVSQTNGGHSKTSNLSHVPCKFFKQGTCTAGANCIFSHNADPASGSSVCKYFIKGNCKFGTKCALLHTMSLYSSERPKNGTNQNTTTTTTNNNNNRTPSAVPSGQDTRFDVRSPPHQGPSVLDYNYGRAVFFDKEPSGLVDNRAFHFARRDPFASSAPSHSGFPVDDQRRPKLPTFSMDPLISGLRTSSREPADPTPSTFARSLFSYSSSNPSMLSSSLTKSTLPLHSIPELNQRYHDVPGNSLYYPNSDEFDDDIQDSSDLNDAMLPSSLNELLTPTELQQRRSRQQATSFRSYLDGFPLGPDDDRAGSELLHGYRSPLATQPVDVAHSFEHLTLPRQQQHPQQSMSWTMSLFGQYGADNEPSSAINIPGAGTPKIQDSRPKPQDRIPDSSFRPFAVVDDDVPFYMEDTEAPTQAVDEPRLSSFTFPSLVSLPKLS
ncbi:hypothetical protein CLU79DRAFT_837279 [Phycomyces nitens]|nr:hypothetical protein CLU79DRAFT_837279 [Phycomyces nitens]